ncbi:hypothetical protein HKD37_12G033761 [Glycine soja]
MFVESAHWSLKRLLQNSLGDICSVQEAMNNMMPLQHTQIKAFFETSMHMVGHVFKVTLYKKTTWHGIKTKLREIVYPDMNFICPSPEKVNTKGASKKPLTKQQKSTKHDPSYWEYVDALHFMQNSNSSVKRSASSYKEPIQRWNIPMLDQSHPCIQDFIENIINVKADGNYGYWAITALLGMGEESWSLVHNHLLKELSSWSEEYINLLGGIERFEELKPSLLVDGLSMVTMDKWMNITDMRYVIASRYNVIVVSLSRQQSMTFFLLEVSRHQILLCIA